MLFRTTSYLFIALFFKTMTVVADDQPLGFLGLPTELHQRVFGYLDPVDRLSLGSATKYLRRAYIENFTFPISLGLGQKRAEDFFSLLQNSQNADSLKGIEGSDTSLEWGWSQFIDASLPPPYKAEDLFKNIRVCLYMDESQLTFETASLCGRLEKLEELTITGNAAYSPLVQLFDSVSQPGCLKRLNVESKQQYVHTDGVERLAAALSRFHNLEYLRLSLSWTPIGNDGFRKVTNALSHMPQLRFLHLYFWDNDIKVEGLKEFAQMLSTLQNLQFLGFYFTNNSIKDEGAKALVNSLLCLPQLLEFSLGFTRNKLTAEGARDITEDLTRLQQLEFLWLGLNDNEDVDELTFSAIKKKLRRNLSASSLYFL